GRYGYVELVSDGHATKAKQAVIARLGSWRTYKGHPEAFDRLLSSLTKLQGRARAKEEEGDARTEAEGRRRRQRLSEASQERHAQPLVAPLSGAREARSPRADR